MCYLSPAVSLPITQENLDFALQEIRIDLEKKCVEHSVAQDVITKISKSLLNQDVNIKTLEEELKKSLKEKAALAAEVHLLKERYQKG